MTTANGGAYAGQRPCDGSVDNLESTPSVEHPSWFRLLPSTGGECKRRALCPSKDLNEIFRRHHSRRVCPPPCFRQKCPKSLPHFKAWNIYEYEGSTCPLGKRHLSVQAFFVSCRPLHFNVWGFIFFSAKYCTVFSLVVSCFWMFCQNRM